VAESDDEMAEPAESKPLGKLAMASSVALAIAVACWALLDEANTWTFEYFENRTLEGHGVVGALPTADLDFDDLGLAGILSNDQFSMRLRSCLHLPTGGKYQFRLSAGSGARAYLQQEVVVDAWKDGHGSVGKVLDLAPGNYPFTVEYYNAGGEARMRLDIAHAGVYTFRSLQGMTERPLADGGCKAI
jgi:hypothetical protein